VAKAIPHILGGQYEQEFDDLVVHFAHNLWIELPRGVDDIYKKRLELSYRLQGDRDDYVTRRMAELIDLISNCLEDLPF